MNQSISNKYKFITLAIVAVIVVLFIALYIYLLNAKKNQNLLIQNTIGKSIGTANSGDLNGALSQIEEVVAADPKSVDSLITKASIYVQKGSIEFKESENGQKALDIISQALKLDPNNSEAYRAQGYAYEIMQKYPEAIASYDLAISKNPTGALAYANRGHAKDLSGDLVGAEADYKKALSIDPNLDFANVNYARILFRQNKISEAKQLFQKVASTSQNTFLKAGAYQNLGVIKTSEKNFEDAILDFNMAIALNPNLAGSYADRAAARFFEDVLAKKFTAAEQEIVIADLEKSISIYEYQSFAYLTLGRVMIVMNQSNVSKAILNQGLAVVDKDITLGANEKIIMKEKFNTDLTK